MDVPKQTDVTSQDTPKEKRMLREESLSRRDALDEKTREQKSQKICELLIQDFQRSDIYEAGATIGLFSPFESEVDLMDLAKEALSKGLRIAFPALICKPDLDHLTMEFRGVSSDELYTAPFITQPHRVFDVEDAEDMAELEEYPLTRPQRLDAIVCPLVAFDENGGCLGYGGGFYDRYLPWVRNEARVVGVAFDEQRVDAVPQDENDIPIDIISA